MPETEHYEMNIFPTEPVEDVNLAIPVSELGDYALEDELRILRDLYTLEKTEKQDKMIAARRASIFAEQEHRRILRMKRMMGAE